MKLSADDIEVFVPTYNRSSMLTQTLDSLLRQTARPGKITVLDNGSTDDTTDVVSSYSAEGVIHSRVSENLGSAANFARAQMQVTRPWVMVFHDDDLLHPDYLAHAADIAMTNNDLVLVLGGMSFEREPKPTWRELKQRSRIVENGAGLARLLYSGYSVAFGSALYRSDVFRAEQLDDKYGKVGDRPFLLGVAGQGTTVVLEAPYVKYRTHGGQDSSDGKSGPFPDQLAHLHALYRSLLGENLLGEDGRAFVLNNYGLVRSEFLRMRGRYPETKSFPQYVDLIRRRGGTSAFALVVGALAHSCRWPLRTARALKARQSVRLQ